MHKRNSLRAATAAAVAVIAGPVTEHVCARGSVLSLINQDQVSLNGALFVRGDAVTAASGILQPFVRLRHDHSGSGREQGYNTSGRPLQYDERGGDNATHNLRFRKIPLVTIDGVAYKEFVLDINEPGNSSRLSIDQIKIYTSSIAGETGLHDTLGNLRFALGNSLNENTLLLDAAITTSSTAGDMRMYVPMILFSGVANSDFVYLYSHFGGHNTGSRSGGSYEQWSINAVPGPSAMALLSIAALAPRRRRKT